MIFPMDEVLEGVVSHVRPGLHIVDAGALDVIASRLHGGIR